MPSSQFLGQDGPQQLIFDAFRALAHSATDQNNRPAQRILGKIGERAVVRPFRFPASPYEYQVTPLRECPTPENMLLCDTPERAAEYWRLHVERDRHFDRERECFSVLLLNVRRRVKGHQLVSIGTHDTILIHPTSVFRLAVATSAAAIVLAHNHPSGEPSPSEADIKVTRDLIRAGQLMKIEVLDHIIMGRPNHQSLRTLGYFAD
jgi:proteasome lid subunit RPN8/RPN11